MTETAGRVRPKYLKLGEGSGVGDCRTGSDNAPGWTLTVSELGALVREEVAEALAARAPPAALLAREGLSLALGCSGSMIDKLRRGGMPHLRLGDSPRFELERCLDWLRQKEGAA